MLNTSTPAPLVDILFPSSSLAYFDGSVIATDCFLAVTEPDTRTLAPFFDNAAPRGVQALLAGRQVISAEG